MVGLFANSHFLLLIYTLIVSLSFHIGHAITNDIHPVLLTFVRFALGASIFSVFVFSRYDVKRPSASDLFRYTLISMSLVCYFFAMFYALRYTSAVNAGLIMVSVPVFTTVFGMIMLKQFPGTYKIMILTMTMLGSVWVIADGNIDRLIGLRLNIGDLIFLGGCVSMGLYPVLSKLFSKGEPTPVLTFWTLATGAVVLAFAANSKIYQMDWSGAPLRLYLGLIFIVLLSTIVTFFIIQYASNRIPVSQVTAYIYLTPVFVLIEDIVITGEFPVWTVWPGVIAVAAGTFLFMRRN